MVSAFVSLTEFYYLYISPKAFTLRKQRMSSLVLSMTANTSGRKSLPLVAFLKGFSL